MASNRMRRLAKELEETAQDVFSKIALIPAGSEGDLTHLQGGFIGPPDTPYEGGKYFIDIRIPSDYPFKPPQMKFKTKIWHPNVSSQTGAICLDTLSSNWSPVFTLKSALISIQSLLASPEPKDPQDAEVAGMLLKDPEEFEFVANCWAAEHAGAPRQAEKYAGHQLKSMKREKILAQHEQEQKAKEETDAGEDAASASGTAAAATAQDEDYEGYPPQMVQRFTEMGFDVDKVVTAFDHVGIDYNEGEDYELDDELVAEITARLFGEN